MLIATFTQRKRLPHGCSVGSSQLRLENHLSSLFLFAYLSGVVVALV